MARNKYPEETINKIVDTSLKLFLEKGYENTSIQEIVDNLGGLSKGAIYHHFKSKDDIFIAVMGRLLQTNPDDVLYSEIKDKKDYTGLEKLKILLTASLNSPRQDLFFKMAPNFLKNPKMLAFQIQSIFTESVPLVVQPFIEEGILDGSIKTDYPKELAEVTLLLLNVWMSPMVFNDGAEAVMGRLNFFRHMLNKLGVDILDDQMIQRYASFWKIFEGNN